MSTDLLFLLGVGLFYLLRRISKQNRERARQHQLSQVEGDVVDGVLVDPETGNPIEAEPAPEPHSILASISALIEQETSMHAQSPNVAPGPDIATEDRKLPERVDTEFRAAADPFEDEWHTEKKSEWSDQTTDYSFHSVMDKSPFRGSSISEDTDDTESVDASEPALASARPEPEEVVDPFEDDGAFDAPGLAELDRIRPSDRLRRMYQSDNKLAEAIVLSEIIGLPVSRRTRSVRRRLS